MGDCGGRPDRVARLRTAAPGTGRGPGQRGGIRPDANDADAAAHRGARTDSHTGTDADAASRAVREERAGSRWRSQALFPVVAPGDRRNADADADADEDPIDEKARAQVAQALASALKDENAAVREQAMQALAEMRSPLAFDPMSRP